MSTTHVMTGEFIARPSKQALKRKLKTAETLGDFQMREGYLYTVVRAISARVNQNYDGWPSEELKKSAHTFIGKPCFVNHENYDPTKARGVIVAARYVESGADKYIEVIQEIDAQRFPKLAHEIRTGGLDSVSMGAEAGFTICSYCGNKAQDVPDMCEHVLFHKGEKLSRLNRKTGRREDVLVYESCYKLSFFELSYVFDPADETAVASKVLVAASGVESGPTYRRPPTWNRPRNKSLNDTKRRWQAEPEVGDSPDTDLSEPDPFDPKSYEAAVLKAAGFHVHSVACPPGQICNPTQTEPDPDVHGPNAMGAGGGGAASDSSAGGAGASGASGVGTAVGGGELGKTPAAGGGGGGPDADGVLPNARGLYDTVKTYNPDIGTYRVDDYHEHDSGALDVMTSDPGIADRVKADAFAAGAPYVLWNQTQWNSDGTSSGMEDRGSPTQNHMDHVHTAPIGGKAASFEHRVLRTAGFKVTYSEETIDAMSDEERKDLAQSMYPGGGQSPSGPEIAQGHSTIRKHIRQRNIAKVAAKCHYCAGDAEEGFSSCTGHRKMEENKFKAAGFHTADALSAPPDEDEDAVEEPRTYPGGDYRPGPPRALSDWAARSRRRGSFEDQVLKAAGFDQTGAANPFTDSSGRYQGPMKTKTSFPPSPYGDADTCPECGNHFALGHDAGCSLGSKWGSRNPSTNPPETPMAPKTAKGRHQMPSLPGKHNYPSKWDEFTRDPKTPPGGFEVMDGADFAKAYDARPDEDDELALAGPRHRASFEARVLEAAGWSDSNMDHDDFMQRLDHTLAEGEGGGPECEECGAPSSPGTRDGADVGSHHADWCSLHPRNIEGSVKKRFQARVLRAWGETEAPAAVDTMREEGSAPEDDNNDFYHYVEPPKELQTPDLSEAAQIDREQDQSGQAGMDGQPGPSSPDAGMGGPQAPQQQFMELKIPIPQQGQAGAPGAGAIPMQPYQDTQPAPAPAGPPMGGPPVPPGPPQQMAASTLGYFDRYFGRRVARDGSGLQTLGNRTAVSTTSRNPMKGTANMARDTLASRGKAVTASRRQHFAEGPLVDSGDQSRNDQGEQEEIFLSQTPPAVGVETPKDGQEISNTEGNLVARVQRGRAQLLADAQKLANLRARRRTAGDAGGPVATTVNPSVGDGEELTGDHFESANPNEGVTETQPKDASLHAFKAFDKWLASSTGKPSRAHSSATIKRAAADFSRKANISVQAMYPALGIVLREARKNEKAAANKGAKMRKRSVDLEVAAPDGRIDVEAPVSDTTDAEAQASQYDLHDFGNNAGDNIADPDLSTDQNWAPGEANKTSRVKTAGGLLAFRCAEAMIAAGLEPNSAERKYALAAEFEHMNRGLVQDRVALCERFAAVLQNVSRQVASGRTRGAALKPPVPTGLTQGAQRTAAANRLAANDPRNDSGLFV